MSKKLQEPYTKNSGAVKWQESKRLIAAPRW